MINGFKMHDAATAPAASAEMLNGVQKAWGFVPNLHRILAESPAALEAYSTLGTGSHLSDASVAAIMRFSVPVTVTVSSTRRAPFRRAARARI